MHNLWQIPEEKYLSKERRVKRCTEFPVNDESNMHIRAVQRDALKVRPGVWVLPGMSLTQEILNIFFAEYKPANWGLADRCDRCVERM